MIGGISFLASALFPSRRCSRIRFFSGSASAVASSTLPWWSKFPICSTNPSIVGSLIFLSPSLIDDGYNADMLLSFLNCRPMAREMSGTPQVRCAEGATAPQWGEAKSG
jgi:hypothetical protein